MKSFNIKRFRLALKNEIVCKKSEMLRSQFSVALAFLFIQTIFIVDNAGMPEVSTLDGIVMASHTGAVMLMLIGAGQLFRVLETKQGRIQCFMLPVSLLEKFLVRFLYVTVGWALIAAVGFVMADVVRVGFAYVVDGTYTQSAVPLFFNIPSDAGAAFRITCGETAVAEETAIGWLAFALVHSVFVLGSAFFSKKAPLWTMLSLIALLMLASYMASQFLPESAVDVAAWGIRFSVVFKVAAVVWTIVNYWLAYRIYARMQVVGRKWINL
ncbi:MAG: hypothetical protein MR681_03800 [Prevotella sp.]|nr:hypothetical protein [Prevotella sp.]